MPDMKLSFDTVELSGEKEPSLSLGDFNGPLDLLLHLIKQHRIDIMDLPIGMLTEQYLLWTADLSQLDLDQASAFLVMAAELLQIKSRMLLPDIHGVVEQSDARTELALRLLAYRRCKNLAEFLEHRQSTYEAMAFRRPARAKDFDIHLPEPELLQEDVSYEAFGRYADLLENRNRARYQDLSEKLEYITRRESIPLRERIRSVWHSLRRKGRAFFHELVPQGESSASQVASFLSVLELMKQEELKAEQKKNFSPILLRFLGKKDQIEWDETEDYE